MFETDLAAGGKNKPGWRDAFERDVRSIGFGACCFNAPLGLRDCYSPSSDTLFLAALAFVV